MNTETRYEEWLHGFRYMIYSRKTMTQAALSKKTGAAREHLNAVLRKRTDAGQKLQDRINNALGISMNEMRELGREHPTPIEALPADIMTPTNFYAGVEHGSGDGEIARDIYRMVSHRLEGMDVEGQIAVRARIKAALAMDDTEDPFANVNKYELLQQRIRDRAKEKEKK